MTNREAYKDTLDNMLARIVAVVDDKPILCEDTDCKDCLFRDDCGEIRNRKKFADWLNAEYQEPPVDWSKVPIDTPVLASDTGKAWTRRHFAGIDESGNMLGYAFGKTLWSSGDTTEVWQHMKLAEENE